MKIYRVFIFFTDHFNWLSLIIRCFFVLLLLVFIVLLSLVFVVSLLLVFVVAITYKHFNIKLIDISFFKNYFLQSC